MAQFVYGSAANLSKLTTELKTLSFATKVAGVTSLGSSFTVHTSEDLTVAETDELDALIDAHDPSTTSAIIKNKILSAMDFGHNLMADYATKRVMRGAGLEDTKRVLEKLQDVQTALVAGSLYVALDLIGNKTVDADILQEDLDEFTSKIQQYLGL